MTLRRRLVRDDLDRRIVSLAIPALGTLAIEPAYVLVDTAIVGRLGTDPLGGLALAATVLTAVVSLANFLQYGVTPAVAHAHGAGRPERAAAVVTQALWLVLLGGIPVGLIVGLGAPWWVRALGGEDGVYDAAVTYLRISAVGLPFVLLAVLGHGVLRGVNDLRRPLVVVAVANGVNVVAEIVAVYGLDLGVAGSAWSTVIVQVGAGLWFLHAVRPHITRTRPDPVEMRSFGRVGGHLSLRVGSMYVVWFSAAAVAARIDTPTLAAHQLVMSVFMFLALGLDALAIPAQSLVAAALGAGDRVRALAVARASTRLSLWCAAVLAVILGATSWLLPHLFTADGAVVSRATAGLAMLAIIQLPAGVAFALDGALIGAEDFRFLGRAAAAYLAVWLPLLAIVLAVPALGIAGLWGAQLVWMTVRAIVNHRRLHHGPLAARLPVPAR